jgi:hypothetical protein
MAAVVVGRMVVMGGSVLVTEPAIHCSVTMAPPSPRRSTDCTTEFCSRPRGSNVGTAVTRATTAPRAALRRPRCGPRHQGCIFCQPFDTGARL